ncbi:hypothetical protein [Flavobacterium yafengii]|uniref:Uncharacterized protein n=1 Tax=Flavobacterium yafengii TaxID=3041253 RepID=A0AAW6TMZ6_9FLAO|nr:hypothetical protein [Flavobacterium yafengii]MDI5950331.1 hypothetical protein [Flavobacterium yafengii]
MKIAKKTIYLSKDAKNGLFAVFYYNIGIAKNLLILNLKRLKEWAFAGFVFDVIFAFRSGRSINSNLTP